MSVIEDVRKVVQDLVAPDLKAIDVRLTSLEHLMSQKFESVEKMATVRHDMYLSVFQRLESTMAANHAAVLHVLDVD